MTWHEPVPQLVKGELKAWGNEALKLGTPSFVVPLEMLGRCSVCLPTNIQLNKFLDPAELGV